MATLLSGSRLEIFQSLPSTSDYVREQALDGETGPLWALAKVQTAGYGRRGRAWLSEMRNFTASLLFSPAGNPETRAQLSFVAGLATINLLETVCQPGTLQLKWPNDILANGAKVAGLLLESVNIASPPLMSLGIGINLVSNPQNLDYPTAKIVDVVKEQNIDLRPEVLVASLDQFFWREYEDWRLNGFVGVRERWLANAAGLNEEITVNLPTESLHGHFHGLSASGALELRQGERIRTIGAGEVVIGRTQQT